MKNPLSIFRALAASAVMFTTSVVFAAQPLPQGKANFSVCYGKMDTSGTTWVRLANWTFTASTGRVAETYWNWDTNNDVGKTALNSHLCTMDGVSKTCYVYTPTGWMVPSGQYSSWSGAYTYNTSTGALHITWDNGNWEDWTVTLPETGVARVAFAGTASYTITHGRGYGSNAAWTVYCPITSVPRINYPGYRVQMYYNKGAITLWPSSGSGWYPDAVNLTNFTSPTGGGCLHYWNPSTNSCTAGCGSGTHGGTVSHLGGNNSSRNMVLNYFCSCLTPDTAWPCYTGNMHPFALQQVIDDSGAMRGWVGIEAQNMAGYTNWEFMLRDNTTIP
ncbi:MAG: hypothetical protein HZA31_00710 [Opitutae bacterium]|nr:hypothetical protein [Opitutae bacterium]